MLDISYQEMDCNGSGFFRLRCRANSPIHDDYEYLTFMAVNLVPDSLTPERSSFKKQTHKSSIYILTQVHKAGGTISVQRTNVSLEEWLAELERRRDAKFKPL